MKIKKYLELIRVNQWVKNLLVFAPVFFSLRLNYPNLITIAFVFLSFSLAASSIYIINDLLDVELDKKHPWKKLRPIASKLISSRIALLIAFFFIALSIMISLKINEGVFYIILSYFLVNLLYSQWLKKVPIIDVMVIAIGFILRITAGAVATNIVLSPWIILCTFFGALFIGFGKRKSEINNSQNNLSGTREVLFFYEANFLNQLIGLSSGMAIMSYALYTIDEKTVSHFNTENLIYTILFVVFGIFRYFQIIHTHTLGEDPVRIFLTDSPILLNLFLWVISFGVIIYFV